MEKLKNVRDNDYFTGEFRGTAHSTCKLESRNSPLKFQS